MITSSRVAAGSKDSITASSTTRNTVPTIASGHCPTPVANPIASVDSITPASFGSFTLARYRTSPAAPTMPKARARLVPTTSITSTPTTARMICE